MSFEDVTEFENEIANFYGAPYAIAVDCCTHAIELCLRYNEVKSITIPKRTYISIPFLAYKLNIELKWKDENWVDYYYIDDTNIIDAAVFWKEDGYINDTFMCLSFQFQKHLSLSKGGMILTDDEDVKKSLQKMVHDGRKRDMPWRDQDYIEVGYHYYMTPEIASLGLEKIKDAISTVPKKWVITDWPDLSEMSIFKPKIIAYLKRGHKWSEEVKDMLDRLDLYYEIRDINLQKYYDEVIEKSGNSIHGCSDGIQPSVEYDDIMLVDVSVYDLKFILERRMGIKLVKRD